MHHVKRVRGAMWPSGMSAKTAWAAVLIGGLALTTSCQTQTTDGGVSDPVGDEELGSAQVSFEDGDTTLVITEESGTGSLTTKVTEEPADSSGDLVKVAEVTVDTGDDVYKITYDENEQPVKVSGSSVEMTMTPNDDGTFDYTVSSEGQEVVSETKVAATDELASADAAARTGAGPFAGGGIPVSAGVISPDSLDAPMFVETCLTRSALIVVERIPGLDPAVFEQPFFDLVRQQITTNGVGARMLKAACVIRTVVLGRLDELVRRCDRIDPVTSPGAGPRCRTALAAARAVRRLSRQLDAVLFGIARHVFGQFKETLAPRIIGPSTVAVGETALFTSGLGLLETAGLLRPDAPIFFQWILSTAPGGNAVFETPANESVANITGTGQGAVTITLEVTVGTIALRAMRDLGIAPAPSP